MFEFAVFGSVVTGVLYAQHRLTDRKSKQEYIERVFRNTGIAIPERDKHGNVTAVKFPTRLQVDYKDWGVSYLYKLPVGMSYKMLADAKNDIDSLLEGALNKDVVVNDKGGNVIQIKVYKNRLPRKIAYNLEWLNECKGYSVVVGVDHDGLVFHDFNETPHLIIGGMTRYGKSVVMKLLITQLVLKRRFGLKFHLFDLKGGLAFNRFKRLPQVHSVSRSVDESLRNLKNLRNQILKRMAYFESQGYEDIGEAWKAGERIDREIIIIDEASVLAPQSKSDQERNECKNILEFIAQVAGGLGYNLLMCSQYPTGDILPRQVKQNSDARLSFRLPTSTASGVILDEGGAEDIPYGFKGRAIYKKDLKKVIQVPILENAEIDKLIEPFKQEELVHDEQGEEGTKGLGNSEHVSETGHVQQVAASAYSPFGKQPERHKGTEEPGRVSKPLPGYREHLLPEQGGKGIDRGEEGNEQGFAVRTYPHAE